MNRFMISIIQFYRSFLSVIFGGNCRFYPSCSVYAQEAFKKKNFFEASYLVIKRLASCHPFGRSGYDPVPEGSCFCKPVKRETVYE